MLSENDRLFVEEKLLAAVVRMAVPRQGIVAFLHVDLAAHVSDGTPADLVRRVIALCINDGYAHVPPALVELLTNLIPHDAEIATILNRIKTPPPAAPDPFDDQILSSKMPFLDRQQTRAALRALVQPFPTQPVVVVTGDKKTGKSYTSEFIAHLAGKVEGMLHCKVEISPTEGASVGAKEIARELVVCLGGNLRDEPPATTNMVAYVRDLVNWVIAEASKDAIRWWIVIDGFTNEEMRDDTRRFLIQLSKGVTQGVARTRHRLILLDFDRTILPLQPGLIASEKLGGIPRAEVEMVVEKLILSSGKRHLDADQLTTKIVNGFSDPITDLQELNNRLSDLIAVTSS
jgi:hypothetical protein